MTSDEKTTLQLVAAYRAALAAVEAISAARESSHERLPGRRGDPGLREVRAVVAKRNEQRTLRLMEAMETANIAWRDLQQHVRGHSI